MSSRNSRQGTEFVEIPSYVQCVHLVHRAFNSRRDLPFNYRATQVSKRWDTVSHEKTSLQNTVTVILTGIGFTIINGSYPIYAFELLQVSICSTVKNTA